MRRSRLTPNTPSSLTLNLLGVPDTLASVSTMRMLVESCLGPHGCCKLIHNNTGGHVTVTSSTRRVLESAQISSPVLRLVSSTIERHANAWGDGTTLAAALGLMLIEESLKNQHRVTEIYNPLLVECSQHLQSSGVCLTFDSLTDMTRLVEGIN